MLYHLAGVYPSQNTLSCAQDLRYQMAEYHRSINQQGYPAFLPLAAVLPSLSEDCMQVEGFENRLKTMDMNKT